MSCGEDHCITCGDVAVELTVVTVDDGLALCTTDEGARETVDVALVAPVCPGDHVLVHAGTAIASTP